MGAKAVMDAVLATCSASTRKKDQAQRRETSRQAVTVATATGAYGYASRVTSQAKRNRSPPSPPVAEFGRQIVNGRIERLFAVYGQRIQKPQFIPVDLFSVFSGSPFDALIP